MRKRLQMVWDAWTGFLLKCTFDTVRMIGMVITGISLHALSGYLTHQPSRYTWFTHDIGMAFSTSCSFILVGIALWLIGNKLREHQRDERAKQAGTD